MMLAFVRFVLVVFTFSALPGAALTAPYVIDQERAEVRFSYSITLSSGVGRFTSVSGTADINDAALDKTTVEALIDTRTLRTPDQMWQGELRGADFFNVAQYPQMRFKSTSVRPKNATTGEMTGDMTIKSVTRPIVLHVTLQPPDAKGARAFRATTRINRNDFNMTSYAFLVGETVDIEISAVLVPAQ
jgi:polyisoprenoid-binding protein YceI